MGVSEALLTARAIGALKNQSKVTPDQSDVSYLVGWDEGLANTFSSTIRDLCCLLVVGRIYVPVTRLTVADSLPLTKLRRRQIYHGGQVASFNAGRTQSPSPLVTQVIKKMAGGSQSRLVLCDDGKIYVLKMHPNPQGPCVLANEALGASLMEGLGFVTPKWRQL